MTASHSTQTLIDALVRATGANSPRDAIRIKARELIETYVAHFGEPSVPIDMDVLVSLRSIRRSKEKPLYSLDAELAPDEAGGVTMRVNPDRPETRQRFSIAHEISHTFFPNYTNKEWCRTDARYRNRSNPDEHLEMLCDIGAAELLFPQPWFARDAANVTDAAGLVTLAATYRCSREATIRHYAETSPEPVAAVYFVWKLKPTQQSIVGNKDQPNLFGTSPEEEVREALRLRIEYTIPSDTFKADGYYLPRDKSIKNDGPIYEAAATGVPAGEGCFLELGNVAGTYNVMAVPLWTRADQRGANGENIVAAVLQPVEVQKPQRRQRHNGEPSLFDAP